MRAVPRLLPILRLLRVGTLFSPAADVLASAAVAGLPFDSSVARAMASSVCLYAAGMVWNDIADRRVDRVQRPERPLVRGDVSLPFAMTLGALLLVLGIGLSPCRWHHGLIAALVLTYDFGSKALSWLSVPLMGSLRGLNLGTALAMPLALDAGRSQNLLGAAICYGIYIAAVTVLGICEDHQPVRGRVVVAVQTVPPIVALLGILVVQAAPWPAPAIACLPIGWFLWRCYRVTTWQQATIRRSMMFLLLGTMLYTALLSLAAGATWAAAAIAAAILPARWIARRIALT